MNDPHPSGSGGDFFPMPASSVTPGEQTPPVHLGAIVLSLIFLVAGSAKLLGLPYDFDSFGHASYPAWATYVVGVADVLGAILFARDKTRPGGAAILILVMVGALVTHLLGDNIKIMLVPASLLLAILAVISGHELNAERTLNKEEREWDEIQSQSFEAPGAQEERSSALSS